MADLITIRFNTPSEAFNNVERIRDVVAATPDRVGHQLNLIFIRTDQPMVFVAAFYDEGYTETVIIEKNKG